MNWDSIFGGLAQAGIIDRAAVAGASEAEKMGIVDLCKMCQGFFSYCSNGSVRLAALKGEIKSIVDHGSFKFLHIKLKVDLLKIQIQILDKLTHFDEAKIEIDKAIKAIDESKRTLKNTAGIQETKQLIEAAGDTLQALTLAPNQRGMVTLDIKAGTQAIVAHDNEVENRAHLDIAFMVPKAELLILKGDILRKEARNEGDAKYLEASSVYGQLLAEIATLGYYRDDSNKDMLNYLKWEAKENQIWAQRLLSETGRVKEKTEPVMQAARDLVAHTKGQLNDNILSDFAYGKACFLLGDLCFEGAEKAKCQEEEIDACRRAYLKLSRPDVLGGNRHLALKIALQYAMALMKPGATKDMSQAVQILNEQIEKAPFERRLYSAMAKALIEVKNYKGALEACERCLANGADDTPMQLLMGESSMKLLENEPNNFTYRAKLMEILKKLAPATKDTSLDVKPTIRLVFEVAQLLMKTGTQALPSAESVKVEGEVKNLFQLLQGGNKGAICQSLRKLNECDSKLLSNFLLVHFFPVKGEFSFLDLAYDLHRFAMKNNAFEDLPTALMIKALFRNMNDAVRNVENMASLNNVSFTTYMHLFVPDAKGIPDFSKFNESKRSSFLRTCRTVAPINDPSEEEITQSFDKDYSTRSAIQDRMGIFNFRRFTTLLDNSLHLTPVENFSQIFTRSSSEDLNLWSEELQIIFQGGFLYGNYPKPEELYAAFYYLDKTYMRDKGMARPIVGHMDKIHQKLKAERLVNDTAVSLSDYAEGRMRYYNKNVNGNNPYEQKGTPYQEKTTGPQVGQRVEIRQTTGYERPKYSGGGGCGGGR